MEADLVSLITGDGTVSGLISTRLYPAVYAQGATNPCARYRKITGSPGVHMQGSDGLNFDLVQIDVRATTAASAVAVRDALRALLHAYSGTVGSTSFKLIRLRDDRGIGHEKTDSQEFYTASLDWDVTWRTAP